MLAISLLDNQNIDVARQVHTVRMVAYQQEASLLGIIDFPPLQETIDEILTSEETSIGAHVGSQLAGVLSLLPDEEGKGMNITSLVVHPVNQRSGIGHALVLEAARRYGAEGLTVQTAAANRPARRLYEKLGFREYRRWLVGKEQLELVKLCRPHGQANSAA